MAVAVLYIDELKVYTTEYCVVCIVTSVNGTGDNLLVESGSYFLRFVFKRINQFFLIVKFIVLIV